MNQETITNLIDEIAPINNRIRESKGAEKISLLWDMGNVFFAHQIKNIHPIAWEIQRQSYITRDLISYAFRIRHKWSNKENLKTLFRQNTNYTLFREAFPLIENRKYLLKKEEMADLLALINSNNPVEAKKAILKIKSKIIGVKNDRSKRLIELKEQVSHFEKFYTYMIKELSNVNPTISYLEKDILLKISQSLFSLVNAEFKAPKDYLVDIKYEELIFISDLLILANAKKDLKSRFIRLVDSQKIIILSDIFNSFYHGIPSNEIKSRLDL